MPLIGTGTSRAVVGCYTAAVFALYYREASPFTNGKINVLSVAASFQIQLTFIGGLFFISHGASSDATLAILILALNCALLLLSLFWSWLRFEKDLELYAHEKAMSSESHVLVKRIMDEIEIGSNSDADSLMRNKAIPRQAQINPHDIVLATRIGAGSFGEVFRGTYLGQDCVVKSMLSTTEESILAFRSEILLTSNLRHPNIIMFFGCCWEKELTCLVLEYAANGSLEGFLASTSGLSWSDPLLKIALDAARGVAYLHGRDYWDDAKGASARGILHRDLKPENILITTFVAAKVSDFGTSRVKETAADVAMTSVGTPLYCAPEISRGELYDERVDVYSFGLVLLAMALREPLADFLLASWKRPKKRAGGVIRMLLDLSTTGWRPEIDDIGAPLAIVGLIKRCFSQDAELRPNFVEIISCLSGPCKAEIDTTLALMRPFDGGSLRTHELESKAGHSADDIEMTSIYQSSEGKNPIVRASDFKV